MRRLLAFAAVVATAACSGAGSSGSAPDVARTSASAVRTAAATSTLATWPTYHGNNRRTGDAATDPLPAPLRRAWTTRLDGAVYAQPLVVHGRVIAATEHNTVYALHPGDGSTVWRRHLGVPVPRSALPCGNIDPLGITGTPAYDRDTNSIFAVTETTGGRHTLWALNARTGATRWHRGLDVLSNRDRRAEQQRAALLVAHHHVYVAFGGLYGDCGNYVGYVISVPTDGTGRSRHYAVPTSREAGIWAAPGPVQHTRDGTVFVASGNGEQVDGRYDGSDSVIELSPRLRLVARFTPSTWRQDNQADLDLGSSAPVLLGSGQVVIAGKRGTVYLVNHLRGVGSQTATLSGCAAYGGAAVHRRAVYLPCSDGVRRLHVGADSMQWQWQASVTGSPVLAGGVVYVLDQNSGDLVQLSAKSGRVRARVPVGPLSRFATPVPVGRYVFAGTMSGVVAVRGSAPPSR
ncbi:MAG TPA: PQQ-binding-like beta-propeller repeat protein [Mycobacteriales bacterium]|nr:PQQ-binding-like beta-propeller repeat protein [Mycobacteriales bacterium]